MATEVAELVYWVQWAYWGGVCCSNYIFLYSNIAVITTFLIINKQQQQQQKVSLTLHFGMTKHLNRTASDTLVKKVKVCSK